ncbi:creatininase family protein [Botrimarina sp.]|uniref:creatininase family protein n=1 Tax=Botrimarina sp. TaxID=2795802 RepID=UPI0032ED0AA7
MPTEKPWRLAEAALPQLQESPPRVAVIPMAATEPHGLHLPYATDVIETDAIGDRACEIAHRRGAAVTLLPTLPFGVQTTQQAYPLAINLNPSTLFAVLDDIAQTLDNSGIRKAVILNGHGGNDFYTWLKESHAERRVFVLQVNWFDVARGVAEGLFAGGGDHANEMETSLVLSLRPELVDMDRASDQATARPRLAAMREGWARAPRVWDRYTKDSGAGDPRAATAEKGEQYAEAVCQRIADLLVELDAAEIDDRFPFE